MPAIKINIYGGVFYAKRKTAEKEKRSSVQDLIDIKSFTKYGLDTNKGELLFYLVSPTNISVLSHTNVEIKIRHLMMVLSAVPDIEINCTDSSECFDDNKDCILAVPVYRIRLHKRYELAFHRYQRRCDAELRKHRRAIWLQCFGY